MWLEKEIGKCPYFFKNIDANDIFMRQKANPAIAERIKRRRIPIIARNMAKKGATPEMIAEKTGQTLEWVRLTIEDLDLGSVARTDVNEPRSNEKAEEKKPKPVDEKKCVLPKNESPTRETGKEPTTVEDVLASYKKIRQDIKEGRWKTPGEAAASLRMDQDLIFRLGKGYWTKK